MKLSCEIIKDLLPLYCDSICSEETKTVVEEHLTDCTPCSEELKKMKSNLPVTVLRKEEGGLIIGGYKMNLLRKFLILFLCLFAFPLLNSFISLIFDKYNNGIFGFAFIITATVLVPNVYIQKIKAKTSPIRILAYSILFPILTIAEVCRFTGIDILSPNLASVLFLAPIYIYSAIVISLYALRFKKGPLSPSQYKKTVPIFLIYETAIILYLQYFTLFKSMADNWPTFEELVSTAFFLMFVWLVYLFFFRFKRKPVFNVGVCIAALGIFLPTYAAISEMIRHNSFHAAAAFWNADLSNLDNTASQFLLLLIVLCAIGASLMLIGILFEKRAARLKQPNQPEQSEHKEDEEKEQ